MDTVESLTALVRLAADSRKPAEIAREFLRRLMTACGAKIGALEFGGPEQEICVEGPEDPGVIRERMRGDEPSGALVYRFYGPTLSTTLYLEPCEDHDEAVGRARPLVDLLTLVAELQRATHEASSDPLTGLANRRTAERELDRATSLGNRLGGPGFSVVMIDLDNLKDVNDAMGHAAGDELLRSFGDILSATVRSIDLASRWGGDEFLLILPGTDARGAAQLLARLSVGLGAVTPPTRARFSAGVATFPVDGRQAAGLVHTADRRLYIAKAGADG